MEEALVDLELAFVANKETPKVAEPCKSSFYLPTFAIAAECATVLGGRACASTPVRADQLDVLLLKPGAKAIAVVGPISNQTARAMREQQALNYGRREGDFRRGRTGEVASQRNTFAVDHHHPLRTFAALGFADAQAPLFAGAKLASTKASLQSSFCFALSRCRKVRQTSSQMPSCSQSCSRRQQVLALGYFSGRSRQRAPLRSTQRMPSSTARLSAQGRPRLFSFGRSGSICFHCSSDRNAFSIPSFPHYLPAKVQLFVIRSRGFQGL